MHDNILVLFFLCIYKHIYNVYIDIKLKQIKTNICIRESSGAVQINIPMQTKK